MSLWTIAWSYIWNRKLTTCLTIMSVALGVSLIYSVLTLREETRKRFEEEGQAFDVVVGAKGSPLQLVLNTVSTATPGSCLLRLISAMTSTPLITATPNSEMNPTAAETLRLIFRASSMPTVLPPISPVPIMRLRMSSRSPIEK